MTAQLAPRPFGPEHPDRSGRAAAPVIAFLGTGRMGGPMAANLARAGFAVRAWDRTASQAAALVEDGATETHRHSFPVPMVPVRSLHVRHTLHLVKVTATIFPTGWASRVARGPVIWWAGINPVTVVPVLTLWARCGLGTNKYGTDGCEHGRDNGFKCLPRISARVHFPLHTCGLHLLPVIGNSRDAARSIPFFVTESDIELSYNGIFMRKNQWPAESILHVE